MKKKHKILSGLNPGNLLRSIKFPPLRRGPSLVITITFIISTIIAVTNMNSRPGEAGDVQEFEAGRVAERDVIAEHLVSYVDENATQLRIKEEERRVPAIFKFSEPVNQEINKNYSRFAAISRDLFDDEDGDLETYKEVIEEGFPSFFSGETLDILFLDENRDKFLDYGMAAIESIIGSGVFRIPQAGLEPYNADTLELLHIIGNRVERETLRYSRVTTLDRLDLAINRFIREGSFASNFSIIVLGLVKPFIQENIFFSQMDTDKRIAEVRSLVDPVVRYIEPGKRVIRKGFIVSGEDLRELRALNLSLLKKDPRIVIGRIFILALLCIFLVFLGGNKIAGRSLSDAEIYLLTCLSALYVIGAVFADDLPFNTDSIPVSIIMPTALVVMLPAILINARLALVFAMALPLSAFFAGSFDTPALIFALGSGVVASYSLQGAEKRMDLVRAGLIIGAANCIASISILLIQRSSPGMYPVVLFWSVFNGIASGMLVLGILPILEKALNAATSFRLIELSDLNTPILKRLFNAAPGTYSHSIMVANLAEAACQEIGANPLLARVGAYYHDLGKMEQSEYFVENQTDYNKHDELSPRLSATVIRSHVKIGIEKARAQGLPQQVIDIIAEHHGNSVISYFYGEALKREANVNVEDFSYPGNPPRSKESAAVMLADVVEAAVRTLQKPTAAKIEKFIQELFEAKVEHGQLSQSELTFRDLETIKKSFVRILAGHYHSRIEYPKIPKEASQASPAQNPSENMPAASSG